MKKVISLALSVFLLSIAVSAQEVKKDAVKAADVSALTKIPDTASGWDAGGLISIAFSQTSFTNWAAGGQNTIGLSSLASFHANYRNGRFRWLNDGQFSYGFQKIGEAKLQKTTDQIAVTSSAGYKMFDHMFLSFMTNFQTQFQPGYLLPNDSILISRFFAPAYLVVGLGFTYNPTKWFSVFLSPATARLTFVTDQTLADAGAFGVKPATYDILGNKLTDGEREHTEIGAYFKGNFSKEVMKNVNVTTSLELFSNYLKDPQNIIVNWVTFLQFKVNKFISATVNTQLIYDNNIDITIFKEVNGVNTVIGKGPRVQFKDVIGVGLAYNL
jgi:hypothetical protein